MKCKKHKTYYTCEYCKAEKEYNVEIQVVEWEEPDVDYETAQLYRSIGCTHNSPIVIGEEKGFYKIKCNDCTHEWIDG